MNAPRVWASFEWIMSIHLKAITPKPLSHSELIVSNLAESSVTCTFDLLGIALGMATPVVSSFADLVRELDILDEDGVDGQTFESFDVP